MRLPNVENARLSEAKLRDYLLSAAHPVGRFKAAFFRRLGFGEDDWAELGERLRALAAVGAAEPGEANRFGRKYTVVGALAGLNGRSAEVVTVWIVRTGDDAPDLVTVYPR